MLASRKAKKWRAFGEQAHQRALPPEERALLRELLEAIVAEAPHGVFNDIALFERAVEHRFASGAPGGTEAELLGGESQRLRSLRAVLGYLVPPGITYYSTRELEAGRDLSLVFVDPAGTPTLTGRIGRPREDLLDVIGLDGSVAGREARPVVGLFHSGGRALKFASRVVRVGDDDRSCLLAHTLEVQNTSWRRFHRAHVGGSCSSAWRATSRRSAARGCWPT